MAKIVKDLVELRKLKEGQFFTYKRGKVVNKVTNKNHPEGIGYKPVQGQSHYPEKGRKLKMKRKKKEDGFVMPRTTLVLQVECPEGVCP